MVEKKSFDYYFTNNTSTVYEGKIYLPNRYTLVGGTGEAPYALNAFDRALISAKCGDFNLVKVTSILPPFAVVGSIADLSPGGIVFAAMGTISSANKGEQISAAVSVGVPKDPSRAGVLFEGSFKLPPEEAEERVREMAKQALEDRGLEALRIESKAAGCIVENNASAFAAVLLWRS